MTISRYIFGLAVLATATANAQQTDRTNSKLPVKTIYRDLETGVSFQFPAAWKRSDPQTGKGYADEGWAIMPRNSDGGARRPRAAIIFSGGPRYAGTVFRELAFIYAVEPAPNLASCLQIFHADESGGPSETVINGRTFEEFSIVNEGACREQKDTVDLTFSEGQCIAFNQQTDTSCHDPGQTGRDLTRAEEEQLDRSLDQILQSVRLTSSQSTTPVIPPPLKSFHDVADGISFQYPRVWKIVQKADSYSPPFLSAGRDTSAPGTVVEFFPQGPYAKTNLEALIFTYVHKKMNGAEDCKKFGDIADTGEPSSKPQVINGVSYAVSKGALGSAGHGIDATTYATYRNGICYAFEADFDTANFTERGRDLTTSEMRALQRHLDAIMQSVRWYEGTNP